MIPPVALFCVVLVLDDILHGCIQLLVSEDRSDFLHRHAAPGSVGCQCLPELVRMDVIHADSSCESDHHVTESAGLHALVAVIDE